MSFIGVYYRNMGEELLRGAETPQTTASPLAILAWVPGHKAGDLEHTTQSAGGSSGYSVL